MLLAANYPSTNSRESNNFVNSLRFVNDTIEEPDHVESGGGRQSTPIAASSEILPHEEHHQRQDQQQVSLLAHQQHQQSHNLPLQRLPPLSHQHFAQSQQQQRQQSSHQQYILEHQVHSATGSRSQQHSSAGLGARPDFADTEHDPSIWESGQSRSANLNIISTTSPGGATGARASAAASAAAAASALDSASGAPPPCPTISSTSATPNLISSVSSPGLTGDSSAAAVEQHQGLPEAELPDEASYEITVKDAHWFLDALEGYHKVQLSQEERDELEESGLREKAKHRNAVLFQDDLSFLLRGTERLVFDAQAFSRSSTCNGDRRVFMLHEAAKIVLRAYRRSRDNAPPKSCIWSALMYRLAYFMQKSGIPGVSIVEHVEGVRHKEATLVVQGYHISRSNFTKLARQLLRREADTDADDDIAQSPPPGGISADQDAVDEASVAAPTEHDQSHLDEMDMAHHHSGSLYRPPPGATGATGATASGRRPASAVGASSRVSPRNSSASSPMSVQSRNSPRMRRSSAPELLNTSSFRQASRESIPPSDIPLVEHSYGVGASSHHHHHQQQQQQAARSHAHMQSHHQQQPATHDDEPKRSYGARGNQADSRAEADDSKPEEMAVPKHSPSSPAAPRSPSSARVRSAHPVRRNIDD